MDYNTPLEHRKQSFKEFMQEWIVGQFERALIDLGLDLPWYWDKMIAEFDYQHHAYQMGLWFWRPTLWWNPAAGVTPECREWLEEKYPGWNASFGKAWDVITENILNGHPELTAPETLPIVCNMSQIPICAIPGDGWNVKDYPLEYEGRVYHFNSEIDRWIFEQEPKRYQGHMTLVDRFLARRIQPPDLMGALAYMSLGARRDGRRRAWVRMGGSLPQGPQARRRVNFSLSPFMGRGQGPGDWPPRLIPPPLILTFSPLAGRGDAKHPSPRSRGQTWPCFRSSRTSSATSCCCSSPSTRRTRWTRSRPPQRITPSAGASRRSPAR